MLTHFGTLFAIWHIYHSLTHLTLQCFTWNTGLRAMVQTCNHTNKMFHVEQRNMSLTIFNKEIFKNIWNVSKKLVSLQC